MNTKFLKITSIILAVSFGLGLLTILPAPAHAESDVCKMEGIAPEVYKSAGCDQDKDQLPRTITNILNAIIAVSGLVAVVFVLIGGINYITSAGDAGKLEKAKKTILYASIGLVICALSFAIVNWTIGAIDNQSDNSSQEDSDDNT